MIVCGINYFATGWRDVIIPKTPVGAGKKVRKHSSQNCKCRKLKNIFTRKKKFTKRSCEKKKGRIKSDGAFDTMKNGSGKDI